jgi:hypothetical protein
MSLLMQGTMAFVNQIYRGVLVRGVLELGFNAVVYLSGVTKIRQTPAPISYQGPPPLRMFLGVATSQAAGSVN